MAKLLGEELLDDDTRSHAAVALGRVGDAEDLADLRRLIEADIQRQKTLGSRTNYSNWYVQALMELDVLDVDATLTELLREQKYEREAAGGLLRLALPPNRERGWPGASTTDYEAIWSARAGRPPMGL